MEAQGQFGCLASSVCRGWGSQQRADVGDIVFNLVEPGLMGRQDSDWREGFRDEYGGKTLEDVFRVKPVFEYNAEGDEWKATYESVVSGSPS